MGIVRSGFSNAIVVIASLLFVIQFSLSLSLFRCTLIHSLCHSFIPSKWNLSVFLRSTKHPQDNANNEFELVKPIGKRQNGKIEHSKTAENGRMRDAECKKVQTTIYKMRENGEKKYCTLIIFILKRNRNNWLHPYFTMWNTHCFSDLVFVCVCVGVCV